MPRFSEVERERIREKLILEGGRLFTSQGLKKVTIDELAAAASIAKATFYIFYESKEALYLDIAQSIQQLIFKELDTLLSMNAGLPGKQRVRQVFTVMYELMARYPMLAQIDKDTVEIISRKVSKVRLSDFTAQNIDAALLLNRHGVRFKCAAVNASYAFQALYQGWLSLKDKEKAVQEAVADLLLHGVIDQVIAE